MITSILLFLAGIFCYSLHELHAFGKLKWMKDDVSFWGKRSHYRKYNALYPAKDNWYYRFFKIPYREKWFTSATLTVPMTDFPHAMQFFYKLLFCSAFYPLTNWWFPVILWIAWGLVFTLCDKYLTK